MRSKFKWIFTLLVAFTMQFSFAQEKTVTGVVSDELGTLAGATVVVKGTTRGVTTGFDGDYSIAAKVGEVLEFSFTGKKKSSITVGASNVYDVVLQEGFVGDEIIVTAYGAQKKESITGSVGEVKAKEIAKITSGNVLQGLTGKVAGVQVINNNGMPGDPPVIRFRGIGSLNGSAAPLYVVDGVPFNGDIASISSQDIESMTFLKDASAAALYGNRGANGVIIVTTKKGKEGKSKIVFDSKVGFASRAVKEYDLITDAGQYYEAYYQASKNTLMFNAPFMTDANASVTAANTLITGGSNPLEYNIYNGVANDQIIDPSTGKLRFPNATKKYDEDWSDFLFGDGLFTQSNLSVSGANDKTKHFLSLGYEKNEGYVVNSDFEKITSRMNLETKVSDRFNVGGSASYTHLTQNYNDGYTGGSAYSNPFAWTRAVAPIYPVYAYDVNGNPAYDANGNQMYDDGTGLGGTAGFPVRPYGSLQHPYATAIYDVKTYQTDNLFTNAFMDVEIAKGLTFTYSATADLFTQSDRSLDTPLYGDAAGDIGGRVSFVNNRRMAFTQQQLLKYDKSFNKHSFNVLLGHETLDRRNDNVAAERTKLLLPGSPYVDQAGTIFPSGNYGGGSTYALEGFFGRVNYDYKEKYFLNASARRDASSRFAPENRWGTFYGLGAAWVVTKEDFMSGTSSWMNNLRLKASYGEQGNDNIGFELPYLYSYTVNVNTDSSLPISFTGSTTDANRDIEWEKNANFNAGFDASFFDSRLNVEAEYFQRKISDMLYLRPLPPSSGFVNIPENNGDMQNTGYELTLSGDVFRSKQQGGFNLNLNFNATHYDNEITKLPENGLENNRQIAGVYVRQEGGSVYDYYMREFVGVNPVNGNSQYKTNINPVTGLVEEGSTYITENYGEANQREIGKSALVDFYGGFSINADFKGFDVSVNMAYQIGGYGYDSAYMNSLSAGRGENIHKDFADTWTPTNSSATLPRVDVDDSTLNYGTSSLGLIKSDYLSIQNVSFGYTFDNKIVSKLGVEGLRFYGLVDNVALWSKRQGYDPRLSLTGGTDSKYSLLRNVSFGINVQL